MEKIQRMLWMVVMTIFSVFGLSAQMQPMVGADLEALQESLSKGSEVHRFEKNEGQFDPNFNYAFRDRQAMYFFDPGSVTAVISNKSGKRKTNYRMNFMATNIGKKLVGSNHFVNRKSGVRNYIMPDGSTIVTDEYDRELNYENLWEGIDAKFYGTEEGLKYDFIVQPGFSPDPIEFEMEGVTDLKVTADGELSFETPLGELKKGRPVTYQMIDGKRVEVESNYLVQEGVVSFQVGSYDAALPLYIDPIALKYATHIGKTNEDFHVNQMWYDEASDALYLTGAQISVFTSINAVGGISNAGDYYAFVAKLKADGSDLEWITQIRTNNNVRGSWVEKNSGPMDILVDQNGDVVVYLALDDQETFSPTAQINGIEINPPVVPSGNANRVIPALIKLSSDGSSLKYFTYLANSESISYVFDDSYQNGGSSEYYTEMWLKNTGGSRKMVLKENGNVALILPFTYPHTHIPFEPTKGMPTGIFGPKPGNINTLTDTTVFAGAIYEVNTSISGVQGLVSSAHISGIIPNAIAKDGQDHIYLTGPLFSNAYYDYVYTGYPADIFEINNPLFTENLVDWDPTSYANDGNGFGEPPSRPFVLKLDSGLSQSLFGSFVGPNSSIYLKDDKTSNLVVDDEGNIYVMGSLMSNEFSTSSRDYPYSDLPGYESEDDSVFYYTDEQISFNAENVNYLTELSIRKRHLSFSNGRSLSENEDDDGTFLRVNFLTKLPASNYSNPEWAVTLPWNNLNVGNAMDLDNNGKLHLNIKVGTKFHELTPITDALVTQGAFQTEWASKEYSQYMRISSDGNLEYSTVIDAQDYVSRAEFPALVVDKLRGTAFVGNNINLWNDSDGRRDGNDALAPETSIDSRNQLPVTPSYRNLDTDGQTLVYRGAQVPQRNTLDGNSSNESSSFHLAVFHEPPFENVIDDFADGQSFCVGSLIYQGANDGPLTGSNPAYVSGDGSEETHNLPLVFRDGIRGNHPVPKSPSTTFQWQSSSDNGVTWRNVSGGNKPFLKALPALAAGTVKFRRIVRGSVVDTSNVITANIVGGSFGLTITGPTGPVYYCPGTETNLGISITGASGNISWKWYDGFTPLADNSKITPNTGSGAQGSFTASVSASNSSSGFFRLVVTDAGGCKKEFFVTVAPLTAKIYPSTVVSFCPGGARSLQLGPPAVSPAFDYKYTGPNGFNTTSTKPSVSDTGTYILQVSIKGQNQFCAGGQTTVSLRDSATHDPVLAAIPPSGFCMTDAPAGIGIAQTAPTGYSLSWYPSNGLDNPRSINPNFNPNPLPFNGNPLDDITYVFRARRNSDGCVFETNVRVTDTLMTVADAGWPDYRGSGGDIQTRFAGGCSSGSNLLGTNNTTGNYFSWEVVGTSFTGDVSGLLAKADFGFGAPGTDIGSTSQVEMFYPATADNGGSGYYIDVVLKTAYFPLDQTNCFATDTLRISIGCGGGGSSVWYCDKITSNEINEPDGDNACGGPRTNLNAPGAPPQGWESTTWSVISVDGVAQPSGQAPKGLFSGGVALGVGGSHPLSVIADINNASWGYPTAQRVVYNFVGTYLENGEVKTCSDQITVHSKLSIPAFELKSSLAFCAQGSGVLQGSTELPYTFSLDDYLQIPGSGLNFEWKDGSSNNASITSGGNTTTPTINPTQTTNYILNVIDPMTGCRASDTIPVYINKVFADAGPDIGNICASSIVQLGGNPKTGHTYQWLPSAGLFYPTPDSSTSTVANPFLQIPPGTGDGAIPLAVTATLTAFGKTCVATDEVDLIITSSPVVSSISVPAEADLTSCGGKEVTLIPINAGDYKASEGFNFTWSVDDETANNPAQMGWIEDHTSLSAKVRIPAEFIPTGVNPVYKLSLDKGTGCGLTTALFTIVVPDPMLSFDNLELAIDGAFASSCEETLPALSGAIGTENVEDFTFIWKPSRGLFTDASGETPYSGGNEVDIYVRATEETTYVLTAKHNATGCVYSDEITVTPPDPVELDLDAGEEKTICSLESVNVGVKAVGGVPAWTIAGYNVNPYGNPTAAPADPSAVGSFADATAQTTSFTPLVYGSFLLRLSVTGACNAFDDVIVRVVDFKRGLAGEGQVVCEDTRNVLGLATAPSNYKYEWTVLTPDTLQRNLSSSSVRRPTLTATAKTTLQLTYTDPSGGCEATETVVIDLAPKLVLNDVDRPYACDTIRNLNLTTLVSGYSSPTLVTKEWYRNSIQSAQIAVPTSVTTGANQVYVLRGVNNFGCEDVATVKLNVEIVRKPSILSQVTIPAGARDIDLGRYTPGAPSVTGGTFAWHTSNSSSSTPLSNLRVRQGVYYLFETGPNGCVSEASLVNVVPAPPRITAEYTPRIIPKITESAMYFYLRNFDASEVKENLGFIFTLPTGEVTKTQLLVGDVKNADLCNGTLEVSNDRKTITYTFAKVNPDFTCVIGIPVVGPPDYYPFDRSNAQVSVRLPNGRTTDELRNNIEPDTLVILDNEDCVAPGKPVGVTVSGNVISWNPPISNGGCPILDYVVEISTDGGATWETLTDSVSAETKFAWLEAGLGVDYWIRVSAVNSAGQGLPSLARGPVKLALPFLNLSCIQNFIVALDEHCEAEIGFESLLVGENASLFPNSYGPTRVYISATHIPSRLNEISDADAIVTGEGQWMYGIYTQLANGQWDLYCWGRFSTEDKVDPGFVGWSDGDALFAQYGTYRKVKYATWSDALNEGSFQPHLWSCWQSTNHGSEGFTWPNDALRTFDTLRFTASKSGILTIIGSSILNTGTSGAAFDPVMALYGKSGFDKDNPCQHLIGFAESTFIPNPLAGLGYSDELEESDLSGSGADGLDIFAPWLLHTHPMARMEVKLEAGQSYTLLITHRAELMGSADFEVYFMLNDYEGGSAVVSSAGLGVDSTYAYFDFLCADVETVMMKAEHVVSQDRYTGGTRSEMAGYLGNSNLGSTWYEIGQALLGQRGRLDTSWIDLGAYNITGNLMDSMLYGYGFMPMVVENCQEWEVRITDSYARFGDCGYDEGGLVEGLNISGMITRKFIVRDKGTKTDTDTAYIELYFRNPSLYDVRLPNYHVSIECDEAGEGLPGPSVTGYPFVSTLTGFLDLTPNNALCNLSAGYEDEAPVKGCSDNYSFRRTWTVYDWCRPGTTVIYHQLIQVGDYTAPVLDLSSLTTSTAFSASNCSGSVVIRRGIATDQCSNAVIDIKVYDGDLEQIAYSEGTAALELSGLSEGTYMVEWIAKDGCGNASSATASFTITDNISPSCVIDDVRTITLTDFQVGGNTTNPSARGEAYLTADRLDEGSWDNCHEVSVQVRRMTATGMTAWGDVVRFTCEDEGKGVLVEMIARAGNDSTICWTNVKVEDKTIPECREIGTVTMVCTDLPVGDLSAGSSVWDQFFADSITVTKTSVRQLCNIEFDANISTEVNIDQCGYGWVNRYYRVYRTIDEKEFADTCRMSVVFSEDHDYWITFPGDEQVSCSSLKEEKVKFQEGGCDLITISQKDDRYEATADECYKVLRTYRVINWCEYDGGEVAYKVERRDWNRDGVMGDATTVNVKYRQGVRHIYRDYTHGGRLDTLNRVGEQTSTGVMVYWESALPVNYSAVTTTLINNGTVVNRRNYVGVHPTPVVATQAEDYLPQGFFEYTQHMKVYDDVAPELEVMTEELNFASYSNDLENGCPGAVSIVVRISDDCTSEASALVVRDVLLDAGNDGVGSVTYVTKKYDASSYQGTTLYQTTFSDGLLTISSSGLPKGTHKFTVVASDGCGNVNTEDIVFSVEDKKGPAPVCIEGFVAELMPTGLDGTGRMATVNAVDFVVNNPIDDCSGEVNSFRITRANSSLSAVLAATDLGASLNLTCTDKGQIRVAVVATDAVGNTDYCVTTITVQDNVHPCGGSAAIAGLIATEENSVVSGVEVSLNGSTSKITAMDGGYFFTGLTLGGDYSIVPKKDMDYLNGVSTYDLVLIQKHILDLQPLNSPYKLIAADVNNSGTISTMDLIQLRRVILALDNGFANNTSWRFVPVSYTFPNAMNPWSVTFPEVLNINNLNGEVSGDFVAIKVGDVNNSAIMDVQPRSNGVYSMHTQEYKMKKGNEYEIEIRSKEIVEGIQGGLRLEGVRIVEVIPGLIPSDHIGMRYAQEGEVMISHTSQGETGLLFTIKVVAKEDRKVSEVLRFTERHLVNEAYNEQGEVMGLSIEFGQGVYAGAGFELLQNSPNPFNGQTQIGFSLPESGRATLKISDVTGRVLKVIAGEYGKGSHTLNVDRKELGSAGVMYYTLTFGEYTATKKMITIE
jgi:hypothetical protein